MLATGGVVVFVRSLAAGPGCSLLVGAKLVGAVVAAGNDVGEVVLAGRGFEGFSDRSCTLAVSGRLFTPQE